MSIKDGCHEKRAEVMKRFKGIKAHYTELMNHREDVNRSIEVLEKELLRTEGELRVLEDLANSG